jgi:hypothetical protein
MIRKIYPADIMAGHRLIKLDSRNRNTGLWRAKRPVDPRQLPEDGENFAVHFSLPQIRLRFGYQGRGYSSIESGLDQPMVGFRVDLFDKNGTPKAALLAHFSGRHWKGVV